MAWNGFYWFTLHHFQHDLPYNDERQFRMPSDSAETDSSLVRSYLSNSHVASLRMPDESVLSFRSKAEVDEIYLCECRFALRMLAALANRNFSVGHLQLFAGADRLTDYRSMDAVFGGMRIKNVELRATEDRIVDLVKTTDFFRLATVQGLKKLKLDLVGQDSLPG